MWKHHSWGCCLAAPMQCMQVASNGGTLITAEPCPEAGSLGRICDIPRHLEDVNAGGSGGLSCSSCQPAPQDHMMPFMHLCLCLCSKTPIGHTPALLTDLLSALQRRISECYGPLLQLVKGLRNPQDAQDALPAELVQNPLARQQRLRQLVQVRRRVKLRP